MSTWAKSAWQVVVIVAGLSLTAAMPSAVHGQAMYFDSQGQFACLVPDRFAIAQERAATPIFGLSPTAATSIRSPYPDGMILIRTLPDVPPWQPLVTIAWTGMHDLPPQATIIGTTVDSVQATVVAQEPAIQFQYDIPENGTVMRVRQMVVRGGARVFVLTLAARASDFPLFYEDAKIVIDSFAIFP